jgi:hypothetical protein
MVLEGQDQSILSRIGGGVDGEIEGVERGESVLCLELESPAFVLDWYEDDVGSVPSSEPASGKEDLFGDGYVFELDLFGDRHVFELNLFGDQRVFELDLFSAIDVSSISGQGG